MKLSNTFKVTTPGELEIVMARDFDAPPDMIFDALTKPELVRRWLLGPDGWIMSVCEMDLKVGGAWRYVWRNEEKGCEFTMHGEYREIVRPGRIVHTEIFGEGESLVTSSITAKGDTTTLTMTMLFASRAERDAALETGMADGVAVSYDRLDEILASAGSRK
ncbi:MAG TPA: SRPBCC family protein [Chthoniobacterales bacterium]|nr:SRPBCC family protein [Chthoniobacterales bacterium]